MIFFWVRFWSHFQKLWSQLIYLFKVLNSKLLGQAIRTTLDSDELRI